MKPELARKAEGALIVDEWESFASAGLNITTLGKSAPQPMVVVVVTGRINRSTERMTAALLLPPDEAVGFAAGIVHSATHLGGRPVPIDTEDDEA